MSEIPSTNVLKYVIKCSYKSFYISKKCNNLVNERFF